MKRNKAISVIAVVLAVLMLVSLVASALPLVAHADELDDLKAKKAELSAKVQEIRGKLEGLKEEQATVLETKSALEEEMALANEQMEIIDAEIRHYDNLIQTKAKEVDAAKNREQYQLERYRSRIRAMEENGGYNILALLFESENFADLLTALDDMGEIMVSDKLLQKQYEEAREETEQVKAQYEAEKAVYEADQAELQQEKDELSEQIETNAKRLEELEEEIQKAIEEFEAAEAAEAAAAATIVNYIASYNAQKAREAAAAQAAAQAKVDEMTQANFDAAANGMEKPYSEEEIQAAAAEGDVGYVSGDSSGYVWPLPCSTRITSPFGTRSDPFTGQSKYHSGIDIDGFGNDGAPVIAAASGVVITASSDSAYGNYVIIDHGNTKTLYAHMSGFAVSYGDSVVQGQTIGYVGATGRATGTHLHFETFVGDGRVDPTQYFSGYYFYDG